MPATCRDGETALLQSREFVSEGDLYDFPRTRRFQVGQRLVRHTGVVLCFTALFGAWFTWMLRGRISLYVLSERARTEVDDLPRVVQAPVDGQVTYADLRLGSVVNTGDVLVRVDSRALELARAEVAIALQAGLGSLASARVELAAEERARDAVTAVAHASSLAAEARVSVDQRSLKYKEEESAIVDRLHGVSAISGLDALRTSALTDAQRGQLKATTAQAALEAGNGTMSMRDREAKLAGFRHAIIEAEGESEKHRAELDTLDYEIERRTIRAPASGTIADVSPISIGMIVTSHDRLAVILPAGDVRVIASFLPQDSVGRVRTGQTAQLRFDNFPWTQFGTVGAKVIAVGQEPRDGTIRVELAITRENPEIPLSHGMTTQCEVDVEQIRPWDLLLRAAGRAARPPPPDSLPPDTLRAETAAH